MNIYEKLRQYFENLIEEKNIQNDDISIYIKALDSKQAIGKPKRQDYPLLNGKEVLLEANYKNSLGQAFTSARSSASLKLQDIKGLKIGIDEYDTAIFIATLNAIMLHFNLIKDTVHCKNEEPELCASQIAEYLDKYTSKKLLLIGYQPAMIEHIKKAGLNLRVLDLNPENIGSARYGVLIEDGKNFEEAIKWSDVILCTGSTIINGSIKNFLNIEKTVYFYGTTIAGPSLILGLKRLCFESH